MHHQTHVNNLNFGLEEIKHVNLESNDWPKKNRIDLSIEVIGEGRFDPQPQPIFWYTMFFYLKNN